MFNKEKNEIGEICKGIYKDETLDVSTLEKEDCLVKGLCFGGGEFFSSFLKLFIKKKEINSNEVEMRSTKISITLQSTTMSALYEPDSESSLLSSVFSFEKFG
jgi:hypothetical protein